MIHDLFLVTVQFRQLAINPNIIQYCSSAQIPNRNNRFPANRLYLAIILPLKILIHCVLSSITIAYRLGSGYIYIYARKVLHCIREGELEGQRVPCVTTAEARNAHIIIYIWSGILSFFLIVFKPSFFPFFF